MIPQEDTSAPAPEEVKAPEDVKAPEKVDRLVPKWWGWTGDGATAISRPTYRRPGPLKPRIDLCRFVARPATRAYAQSVVPSASDLMDCW